nr:hypothetical protein [Bacillota bacterium]
MRPPAANGSTTCSGFRFPPPLSGPSIETGEISRYNGSVFNFLKDRIRRGETVSDVLRDEVVLFEVEGPLGIITLNRPDVMNALNYATLVRLGEIVDAIKLRRDIRAVIFTGKGKAFCVGADLKERRTLTEQEVRRNVLKIRDVFTAIERLPQPTIAVMHGYAFGGGFELALACDFRFASEETMMGLTETSLAIIPG